MHPHPAGPRLIEPAPSATRHRRSKDKPPAANTNVHSQYARAQYDYATAPRVKIARFHLTGPPRFIGQLLHKNGRTRVGALGHPDPLNL
jgi:hypothetical protein